MTARTATCDARHLSANAGERNWLAKHPDAVVRRARLLRQRGGYSPLELSAHLADEGINVDPRTVAGWIYGMNRSEA